MVALAGHDYAEVQCMQMLRHPLLGVWSWWSVLKTLGGWTPPYRSVSNSLQATIWRPDSAWTRSRACGAPQTLLLDFKGWGLGKKEGREERKGWQMGSGRRERKEEKEGGEKKGRRSFTRPRVYENFLTGTCFGAPCMSRRYSPDGSNALIILYCRERPWNNNQDEDVVAQ